MTVDVRKERNLDPPLSSLYISETEVERVSCFKFLGVNICEDITWTHHIIQLIKKAYQRLYF